MTSAAESDPGGQLVGNLVDVGQLENGTWTVIEVGDPQVSASSMIDYRKSWRRLREVVAAYSIL